MQSLGFLNTISAPLLTGLGALALALLTYRLGLLAYSQQKTYEVVRARYLDQGFDLTCAQVEYALAVYRTNWALFLRYLKLCREMPEPLDVSDFFTQFRELDQSQFQVTPAHRIHSLVQDDVIWNTYQQVFSFVGTRNDKIKADFGPAMKALTVKPPIDRQALVAEGFKFAQEMSQQGDAFYVFLSELNNLAQIFEQERLSRRSLPRFAKRADVKQILARLNAKFPDKEEAEEPTPTADQAHTAPTS